MLLIVRSVSAQIVITETDFPVVLTGIDTIKMTRTSSPFPPLPFNVGFIWDMTGLEDSTNLFFNSRFNAIGYEYVLPGNGKIFSFSYGDSSLSSLDSWGLKQQSKVIVDTGFSLTSLTFSVDDSFFIPSQTITYSSPEIVEPFPATYGTWWNAYYHYDIGYKLSLAFPPYDHTPGYVRRFVTKTNTVDGWGWVRINDMNGSPGPDVPVLQVKSRTIVSDSFFLAGAPLPGTLLTLFSVQQGMADTIYEQNYLRKGYVTPLVNVRFKDDAYTQPLWARKHAHRLLPDGVDAVAEKTVSVYPNPVTGNYLHIEGMASSGKYILMNALGSCVATGNLGNRDIVIPAHLANGQYYLCISAGNNKASIAVSVER